MNRRTFLGWIGKGAAAVGIGSAVRVEAKPQQPDPIRIPIEAPYRPANIASSPRLLSVGYKVDGASQSSAICSMHISRDGGENWERITPSP